MPDSMRSAEVLDREFLEIRAKILELAASFDRMERGEGSIADDPRMAKIHEGLEILLSADGERAEQVQLLFSLNYDDSWREQFNIP